MGDPNPPSDTESFVAGLLTAGATARVTGTFGSEPRLLRLRIRRLMHPPPPVLDPETSLAEADRLFLESGADWLPVVERGRLVGVVTRSDLARWLLKPAD